jgi:hypothetical protein
VAHVHTANLVLAGTVVLLTLAARGAFCGWLCPLGAIQEAVHGVGDAVTNRIPPLRRTRRRISANVTWLARVDHIARYGRHVVLAWAVVGAAVTGVMVFREYDPWSALLSVMEFEVTTAFVIFVVMLIMALVVERPFCRYACPLGAVIGIVGSARPVPTTPRLRSAQVATWAYVVLIVAVFTGSILVGRDLGWFATTGRGTPSLGAVGVDSHVAPATGAGQGIGSREREVPTAGAVPEDVKGWMTVQQVLDAFPVTKAALYERFGIPAGTPTSTTLSALKEAGDLNGFDVPTLRTWLREQAPWTEHNWNRLDQSQIPRGVSWSPPCTPWRDTSGQACSSRTVTALDAAGLATRGRHQKQR